MASPAWYDITMFTEEKSTETNFLKNSQHQDLFLSEPGRQFDNNEWRVKMDKQLS